MVHLDSTSIVLAEREATRQGSVTGRSLRTSAYKIIVSEPSAEATRAIRTDRLASIRRRSSAARNDTPRYADA
jgi:hypothetical protein